MRVYMYLKQSQMLKMGQRASEAGAGGTVPNTSLLTD